MKTAHQWLRKNTDVPVAIRRVRAIDVDPDIRRSRRIIEQLCVYLKTHACEEYVSPRGYRLVKITRCAHCDVAVHAEQLA